ncbi:hypothetical protein ACFPM1_09020, partial [Halorubrum rubrum]
MYRGFELTDSEIKYLNPYDAVEFFRDLLWAEASETSVIQSSAHVPMEINRSDGGLDAKIEDADPRRGDIIPAGDSGFQIKSSALLNPMTASGSLFERLFEVVDCGGQH